MFSESYMNLFPISSLQEEESSNIFGPLNENPLMDTYQHEDCNYPSFLNEDFKMDNEMDEKNEPFFPNEETFKPNFIPFQQLNDNNFQFGNDFIEDKDLFSKNVLINDKNEDKISDSALKKTANSSKENGQPISIKAVSKSTSTKKPSKRIDYALKYFKTSFSGFLKEHSNRIIQKSALPANLKKKKIFSPNHQSYTGNPKESDDYKFLSFTVQEILSYYKDENCKNSLQKKNKETIEEILNFIDESKDESKYEEVRAFFKMSLEDAYELFYQDESFKKYANDEKAIYLDQEFRAQNGFSLLENNGFIKVVKMHGKKK